MPLLGTRIYARLQRGLTVRVKVISRCESRKMIVPYAGRFASEAANAGEAPGDTELCTGSTAHRQLGTNCQVALGNFFHILTRFIMHLEVRGCLLQVWMITGTSGFIYSRLYFAGEYFLLVYVNDETHSRTKLVFSTLNFACIFLSLSLSVFPLLRAVHTVFDVSSLCAVSRNVAR